MELQTFISETLLAIVGGVTDAQEALKNTDSYVNPGGLSAVKLASEQTSLRDNRSNNFARTVAFDVAITADANSTKGGRVTVLPGILNVTAGGELVNKYQSASRVQFDVTVLFPVMQLPPKASFVAP